MPKQSKNQENKKGTKSKKNSSEFFGTATIGTKGQFVIPKEARDTYNMKPGDKIVIFGGEGGVLAVIKKEQLNEVLGSLAGLIDIK